MKLKLKKDILIKKGTVFEARNEFKNHYCTDDYDTRIALYKTKSIHDASMRILVSSENKEFFEEVK